MPGMRIRVRVEGDVAQKPDDSEEADDLVKRLEKVSVPRAPDLPPVPEIQLHRPSTHIDKQGGHSVTVRVGEDRPSGTAPAKQDGAGNAASLGAAMGAGVSFAASIIVGFLIGQWIDHKLGLDKGGIPWGTLVMTLGGMAAGFVNLFKLLKIDDNRRRK
jgi:F0F1-type ATP synthase assembly protein I